MMRLLALVLLLGTILSPACVSRDGDRPPIIVSSGSVLVQTAAEWTRDGDNRFKQKIAKGKSVKSFSASTGACVVDGEKLLVTYGTNTITLEPKRSGWFGARDAQVDFPAGAVVDDSVPRILTVTTGDALVSVANDEGTSCAVVDQ
ncbi:MAG: hypothetical protein NUW22_04045, partial [Acidobacteria bacterium]|nr:hypothetical protein [Acidobacteriota bacterium]